MTKSELLEMREECKRYENCEPPCKYYTNPNPCDRTIDNLLKYPLEWNDLDIERLSEKEHTK